MQLKQILGPVRYPERRFSKFETKCNKRVTNVSKLIAEHIIQPVAKVKPSLAECIKVKCSFSMIDGHWTMGIDKAQDMCVTCCDVVSQTGAYLTTVPGFQIVDCCQIVAADIT